MPKQVKGFLAEDGTFFENAPECKRYEAAGKIESLCVTHNINPNNFLALLRAWHEPIKEWYNADGNCKSKQANGTNAVFEGVELPQDQDDQADSKIGDKDAPGFLEQSFGKHQ